MTLNGPTNNNTTPVVELLALPAEILTHICTHLVPSEHTFLLNARVPESSDTKSQFGTRISLKVPGTPLRPEPGEDRHLRPLPPATIFEDHGVDIFDLLLLHSTLYPSVVECLYSRNVFCPPDLFTLFYLRDRLSALAVASIRCIRIDACGPATLFTRGYNYYYSWAQLADPKIVEIPGLFPGIRELRLGGVGPGVVHRRAFTYRGSRCVREAEVNDTWSVDSIELVSRIIGKLSAGDGLGDIQLDGSSTAVSRRHTLSGGRVLCTRYNDQADYPRGFYRLYGTRIVRRGEVLKQGSMEQEVVDVAAVMARAREVREECKASGLTEVSVYDVSFD